MIKQKLVFTKTYKSNSVILLCMGANVKINRLLCFVKEIYISDMRHAMNYKDCNFGSDQTTPRFALLCC